MTTPQEIDETLIIIRNVWNNSPELRLCQLLSNAASVAKWKDNDLYYLRDPELRIALKNYAEEMMKKR